MKIGEAIQELCHLDIRLEALQSRLLEDKQHGRPLTHVLEQIISTLNRERDLKIALNWTHQHLNINQLPLGSYTTQNEYNVRLIKIFEEIGSPELREQADNLYETKKRTDLILQSVYWAQDLLVPEIKVQEPEEEN